MTRFGQPHVPGRVEHMRSRIRGTMVPFGRRLVSASSVWQLSGRARPD